MLLDDAMPEWDRRSRHRIATDLPPDLLLAAIEELTWAEVPVFRTLLRLRGLARGRLPPDSPVLGWFDANGFRRLARSDHEFLVVATEPIGRRSAVRTPPDLPSFRHQSDPGCIKIATNFLVADGSLITETRVRATDDRSRRLFAAYWLIIHAGSGLIRRVWLRAIRSHARALAAGRMLGAR